MTILSIVCTKLLCTNAHLGRRVADHHFKVYIRGSRNGIAILDSDKTLICLRNALHFIGSPSRQKGRSFFLKTNHLFYLEIMEEMASYLRNVNSHCFDDSQWKIGAFLTNSFANKKKFRSRKKKIHFGLNQQPDCVVILNADRKSSVILEADRSQIPIASLGDSTIPWESYKRITYPIPSRDTIEIVYFFCHSIMKTVILEWNAIKVETQEIRIRNSTLSRQAARAAYSSTSSPKRGNSYFFLLLAAVLVATALVFFVSVSFSCSWIAPEQLFEWLLSLSQSVYHILRAILEETLSGGRDRCAPLGGTELMANPSPEEETSKAGYVSLMNSSDSEASVNQQGSEASVNQQGINVPPLALDFNEEPAKDSEKIRQEALEIRHERISKQYDSFTHCKGTKKLFSDLCAYEGDANQVKQTCIQEIEDIFDSTDAGLIDFVKETNSLRDKKLKIFDLIKIYFNEKLSKYHSEEKWKARQALQNANPEEE